MDKELDDLLDSALGDFDQKLKINEQPNSNVTIERTDLYVDDELDYDDRPATKPTATTKPASAKTETPLDPNFGFNLADENLKLFEGIFNEGNAGSDPGMKDFKSMFEMFQSSKDEASLLNNFQKVMSELVNEEANIGDGDDDDFGDFENIEGLNFFKNLASAAAKPSENESTTPKASAPENSDLSSDKPAQEQTPLQKVLQDMNKSSEKVLKNSNTCSPFNADFLSSLTQGLNLDETGENNEPLDSATSLMMQPILSMLFSKEILYPSLKLMSENYDKYISDKKETLSEVELQKCHEQKEYIKQMCDVYEGSNETDSKEAKAEQLKKILELLEKCGMPPSELVPEVNPFEGLGDQMKTNGCPVS